MINPFLPLTHLDVKFFLEGNEYMVEHFKVAFAQPTDHKGQPQHEIRGGQLVLVLSQAADDLLYDWAKRSTKLKDGEIVFHVEMSSPPLTVTFNRAYCIKLSCDIDEHTGIKTSLVISPEQIIMNGIEHNNFWKK